MSSFAQGLHQVAQKLITIGLPWFSKLSVLMVLPSIDLILTEGSIVFFICAIQNEFAKINRPEISLTVDYPQDYKNVNEI